MTSPTNSIKIVVTDLKKPSRGLPSLVDTQYSLKLDAVAEVYYLLESEGHTFASMPDESALTQVGFASVFPAAEGRVGVEHIPLLFHTDPDKQKKERVIRAPSREYAPNKLNLDNIIKNELNRIVVVDSQVADVCHRSLDGFQNFLLTPVIELCLASD